MTPSLRKIPPSYWIAALGLSGLSIFLFSVDALLIRQEYRIAVNPRVMGHIERTWIVTRGRHHQHVRVADFTFTVTQAGKPIDCQAAGRDIGDATFDPKAGDSIELSPTPESCARPHVINVQPPAWLARTLIAIVASAGFVFALAAWGALSDPESRLGSWVHQWLRRRFGTYSSY